MSSTALDTLAGENKEIVLTHNGDGESMVNDTLDVITIDPVNRIDQAMFYRTQFREGKKIPSYLYRYLRYMFIQKNSIVMDYRTDEELTSAFNRGLISESSDEYKEIRRLILSDDERVAHVLGLLLSISLYMNAAKREHRGVTIHITSPEVGLNDELQIRFLVIIMKLKEEFGAKLEQIGI